MAWRIVTVGCGLSGTHDAFYSRKTDRTSEITIIGDETLPEYSRCGLPYAFSGIVATMRSLIGYDEAFYEHTNRIGLKLGVTATRIRPDRRVLELKSQDQPPSELQYDSLILTTGASPTTLAVPGSTLNGVFTIRTMNDVEGLANYLGEAKVKKVAIIGAGLIGSEMAEALLVRGVAVSQAEIVPEILPVILDPDMASVVREKGEEHGVEYHLQSTLEEILDGNGRVSGVRISNHTYKVNAVIVAVRVKPNTELAKDAGIGVGEAGGSKNEGKKVHLKNKK